MKETFLDLEFGRYSKKAFQLTEIKKKSKPFLARALPL